MRKKTVDLSRLKPEVTVLLPLLICPLLARVASHGPSLSAAAPPFPLENSVLAEPRVDCGVETINVWIRTEKQFRGRLYVEDESEQPECVHSYAHGGGPFTEGTGGTAAGIAAAIPPDSRGAEFIIRFGQCNMRRQRLLSPRGVTYSFTLVISFHPVFLTGIDRAFNIKCFFMEAVKALEAALDVSPLPTSVVEREFVLPQCNYHLKHGVDGPFMKYASIGEPITHVWQCDPVAGWLYGVLIHSCFVDDGHGNRFDLIDDRGCVTDRSLLAEIVYDEKSFTAYAHTHVFRYADRVQLFFTCTVQLCFREDGGCEGISPPKCLGRPPLHEGPPLVGAASPPPRIPGQPPPFARLPPHHRPPNSGELYHGRGRPPPPLPHHSGRSPFGRAPPPFKDSPLLPNKNGSSSATTDELLISELMLNMSSNHSRAGRNAGGDTLLPLGGGRMETDLSADLTVVPRTTTTTTTNDGTVRSRDEHHLQPMAMSADKNPFVRVLPIKTDEYGGGGGSPMSRASSLDSQRFSSFEVLAIAAASFVATFTVTTLITSFCLQRCRLRKLLLRKMGGLEGAGEMIIG